MNNISRFALTLFLVNLVAASILAGIYSITKPRIGRQERMLQEEALRQVMSGAERLRLEPVEEGGEVKYWKVFEGADGKPAGYVFIAKKYGYSSVIESMVGMKRDGTITGVRILGQSETPGLGAKIVEVVSNKTLLAALMQIFPGEKETEEKLLPYFTEQFKDLNVRRLELSKNSVEAITGATVSSKAVLESIREEGLGILGK